MRHFGIVRLGIGIATILAGMACFGCKKSTAAPPSPPAPGPFIPGLPTKAQPKLPTTKLWVGSNELISELALTDEQQHAGMMFRTNMAENEAMLFVSAFPDRKSFWMLNTILPLSAAYIDPEGTILEIHDLQPHNTNSVVSASDRIQFVLEVNQGWFKRHNVNTGMVIRAESGPLKRIGRR
jgi:uncharacterized membrane protein (UPF0127 family)